MSVNVSNEELFPWETGPAGEGAAGPPPNAAEEEAASSAAGKDEAAAKAPADEAGAKAPADEAAARAPADEAASSVPPRASAARADDPANAAQEAEAAVAAADAGMGEGEDAAQDDDQDAVFEAARARAERDFAASPGVRERRIAPREYYSISEVCEITGLKPHVLRYWEAQFPLLNPSKNRSGNRVYQRKEIRLILLVKGLLYEEKYTVEGAKAKLEQLRGGGELADATGHALDRHMLKVLRSELRQLAELLTPPRTL